MLETSISEKFLDKFYHELNDHELINSNKLNLFTLKVSNNSFAYNELIEELGNSLYHFALSRTEVNALKKADKLNTLICESVVENEKIESNYEFAPTMNH